MGKGFKASDAMIRAHAAVPHAPKAHSGSGQMHDGIIDAASPKGNAFQKSVFRMKTVIRKHGVSKAEGILSKGDQKQIAEFNRQLTDSIQNFIKDYNATRNYDAILYRASGLYFNPALEITGEIIEGLNARYTPKAE